MMKKYLIFFTVVLITMACGGGGGDGGGSTPEINKDYLSVTPNLELLPEGQTTEITVSSNCSWTITKDNDCDWLTVSPMSGTNSQKVSVSASSNSTDVVRTAVLTVQGGSLPARKVTVTQKYVQQTMTLTVDKQTLNYDKNGGIQSFIITSNTDWTISCPDWCSLSTNTGKGKATISVTVDLNPTTAERSGEIVINGVGVSTIIINVSQQPGEEQSHEPNPDDNLPPS